MRDCLERLAQPHVVCEDAPHSRFMEGCKPSAASGLVGTQLRIETCRCHEGFVPRRIQPGCQGAEAIFRCPWQSRVGQVMDGSKIELAQLQGRRAAIDQRHAHDRLDKRTHSAETKRCEPAAAKRQWDAVFVVSLENLIDAACQQAAQRRQHIDPPVALDARGKLDIEPVDCIAVYRWR
jgi:hypothetical protein